MKQEIMKDWVAALRSGEFTQATGTLRLQGSHCCLGVLCELAARSEVGGWVDDEFVTENDESWVDLPSDVKMWAGLGSTVGSLSAYDSLASLNDNGKTFSEIADIIEANYEVL